MPKKNQSKIDKVFRSRHTGEDDSLGLTNEIEEVNKANINEKAGWAATKVNAKSDRLRESLKKENRDSLKLAVSSGNDMLSGTKYGNRNRDTDPFMAIAKANMKSGYDKIGASNPPSGPKKSYK